MDCLKKIREKAKSNPKNIILPEGEEPRIIEAAKKIVKFGLAHIALLGKKSDIQEKLGITVSKKVDIIEPACSEDLERLANGYYTLRKKKGMTLNRARKLISSEKIYMAAMMVRMGLSDGFVAGASYTTPNVAKAAIYCLEKASGASIVSSSFIISFKDSSFGANGAFIFADCGIVPNPSDKELAEIAVVSAELAKTILGITPRVAMLSYSTKGSARGELVDKVAKAVEEAKILDPSLRIDGELQLDAAIIPEVARIKAPKSKVAGRANVLIFPNLDSGNIAYKLTQRLANARAVGPLLQGLAKPASDLSRGASVEDIVDAVAVTCVRAQ